MRIAMLASMSHPIRAPYAGGLESLTHQLSLELQRRGHDITLYAAEGSDSSLPVRSFPRLGEFRPSPAAQRDPSMVAEDFLRDHHAYQRAMLELTAGEYDLVHNHSLHYLPIVMAAATGHPMVTTLHTPPTPWLESAMASLRDDDPVTFVSVSHANARAWSQPARVRDVIPNGIDLDVWRFESSPERYVVWTGRLVPEKAPHLAIDAARRAGMPIKLAGPVGDAAYVTEELVPRLGPGVELCGHLEGHALTDLVGHASAFLATPVWEEPFGLVVVEALACGTPVVGFGRGAIPELVTAECGYVVPPDDVDALAAAIHTVGGIDRAACRARAEHCASLSTMADRYEVLYDELVA